MNLLLILGSIVAGLVLSIIANWLYDYLKQEYEIINRPTLKIVVLAVCLVLPPLVVLAAAPSALTELAIPADSSRHVIVSSDNYGNKVDADTIIGSTINQYVGPTPAPTPTPTVTPRPTAIVMPNGSFNIAVSAFSLVSDSGTSPLYENLNDLALSIANYIRDQKDTIGVALAQSVEVFGPDVLTGTVSVDTAETVATSINADLLVYGSIQQLPGSRWLVEPRFYLSDAASKQAYDLGGEYALGTAIDYRASNIASLRDVNITLKARIKALVEIVQGISYLSLGDAHSFDEAIAMLTDAAQDPAWGASTETAGQEILFLFLGNAYLSRLRLVADDSTERTELLAKAHDAFAAAIERNSLYGRAHNGMGLVLTEIARPLVSEDECAWDWDRLAGAAAAFEQALAAPPQYRPPSGHVEYRALLGLGQIGFFRGLCLDPTAWDTAESHYQGALSLFDQMITPVTPVMLGAATAYGHLGTMQLMRADVHLPIEQDVEPATVGRDYVRRAIGFFQDSLEIDLEVGTEDAYRQAEAFLPGYLTALCLDNNGQTAQAVLGGFVASQHGGATSRAEILSNTPIWGNCNDRDPK